MTDIIDGRVSLSDFASLAACGGFSYGDVLGAGAGWVKSVLLHEKSRQESAIEKKFTWQQEKTTSQEKKLDELREGVLSLLMAIYAIY